MRSADYPRTRRPSRRQAIQLSGIGAAVSVLSPRIGGVVDAAPSLQIVTQERSTQPLTYYRPAEVTLLLEPRDADAPAEGVTLDEVSPAIIETLAGFLRAADIVIPVVDPQTGTVIAQVGPLDSGAERFRGPRGVRTLIPIRRAAGTTGVLQTVNLYGWREDPRGQPFEDQVAAIRLVGRVVNAINGIAPVDLGPYILRAASPNWLAMPFSW